MNRLHYGDNLGVLRDYLDDESVDLIYLDPPFNSNRNYNVLFREKSGTDSPAQIKAFGDTWRWDEAALDSYHRIIENAPDRVSKMIESLRYSIGDNDMMAYLVMMTERLVELHRVLKSTGSIYLHCDPTASHYLKIIMDTIFGPRNFRNEIVWRRTAAKGDAVRKLGAVHDVILYFSKSDSFTFKPLFTEPGPDYLARFPHDDNDGKGPYHSAPLDSPNTRPNLTYDYRGYSPPAKGWRVSLPVMERLDSDNRLIFPTSLSGRIRRKLFLRDQHGPQVSDVWTDIAPLQAASKERLGYPTQKPSSLLERIIELSSNPGDVVLDPFCGCGTAVAAAQKLGRLWIGIDITHLAVSLMQNRLVDMFGDVVQYEVLGTPADLGSARRLADYDRYEFQAWANSLVHAHPLDGREKKGPDKGIDGIIRFIDDDKEKVKRVIVQVKSNERVGRPFMEQLRGTIERENEPMGLLMSLNKVTRQAEEEAIAAGFYDSQWWGRTYPRLQAFSVEDHFEGKEPRIPPSQATFQRSRRLGNNPLRQAGMFGED